MMHNSLLKLVLTGTLLSSPVQARVFGLDGRSFLSLEQATLYSNVGRVECPLVGNRLAVGTGWVMVARDTMVTAAHSFIDPDTNARLDPTTCVFALYDRHGGQLDRVPIRYARSRWSLPGKWLDASYDVAVVKLARSPVHPINAPNTAIAKNLDERAVTLIAFHSDLTPRTAPRASVGKLYKMPPNAQPVLKGNGSASDLERMFVTDFDTARNASGGMILDQKTGAVIGLHLGWSGSKTTAAFNSATDYNHAIYLDDELITEMEQVAADKAG